VQSGFETRSAPALTHVLPRIRPVGFPIYVAPPGGLHSLAATLAALPSMSLVPVAPFSEPV
jgi:hypothetical protein